MCDRLNKLSVKRQVYDKQLLVSDNLTESQQKPELKKDKLQQEKEEFLKSLGINSKTKNN